LKSKVGKGEDAHLIVVEERERRKERDRDRRRENMSVLGVFILVHPPA
jgi:hypothetical protein